MKKIFSLLAAVLFAGSMMAGQFARVSDMANLAPGDQIILVSESEDYALGATQNTNNRAAVAVTVANDVIEAGENVQVITLEASGQNLKLKVGEDAYLYAASSSSNYLKTADAATAGDNAVWAISNSGDTVTLIAQGTNTRNILHFNPNNGNPIFSCYGPTSSVTALVKIFKAEGGETPIEGVETIYNWATAAADQVGTTILGTTGVEISTVKIHENTDAIPGIKLGSSYVYAEGKWVAIKPAVGGFKAGDVLSVSVVYNNSDATKYCMVDLRAADGDTRIWMSDSLSTLNGRNAGEPIVQTYTLAADQDSLFLGRYGNTGMFITHLKVDRALVPPTPSINYYVAGSMGVWGPDEAYRLTPSNNGEYKGEFTFAANDEFKVIGYDGATVTWFPEGMGNNYVITEAGDYKITFNPEGNVEGWYAGFFNVVKKEALVIDTITCAKAREDALAGQTYETYVKGYVTEIAYAWANKSMSFWMADEKDGGKVFEAYKCAIEKEEDAVRVGDLVLAHGTLTKYNTTPEFAAGCTVEILERDTTPAVEPQNLGEKTIAEFLELKNKVDTCILTGVVLNIKKNDDGSYNKYGNFDLADATDTVYVYGLLTADGVAQKFPEMGVDEGDTLTIKAVYSEYKGNPQAPNAVFVSVKKASQGIEEVMAENEGKTMKFVQGGQIYILRDNKVYGLRGERIR